jgi:hypothetical protein
MLRRIIGIPEVVYYRGRFRASLAWPKVGHGDGEGDSAALDEGAPQVTREADRLLRDRPLPARTDKLGLQVRPAGS